MTLKIALIGKHYITDVIRDYQDSDVEIEFCSKESAEYWLVSDLSQIKHAMKIGKTVIYLSSAQVFEPNNQCAWSEEDNENCESELAHKLLKDEAWVQEQFEQHIILRTTRIISPSSSIWRATDSQEYSDLDDSLLIAPVFAEETARIIMAIIKQLDCQLNINLYGTYHYGGAELFTEYTLAQKLAKIMYKQEIPPTTIKTNQQMTALTTLRLNCQKILYSFGIRQQSTRRLLQRMIELHKEHHANTHNENKS
jgi:dTDP-4-dehydrorhamnose reductase